MRISDWSSDVCSSDLEPLFRAADGPVLPLSFSLGMDRGHAHDGGVRRRRMAARTARTIGPVTATSANWKVMARAWRTTRAPILISLSCRLVNDQAAMASGSRAEEHTSELQSLMRISYAVFCLQKKK